MKKLSREEMKNVKGGNAPAGGGDDYGCYKCCWTGTTNCSTCEKSYSTAKCSAGATLTSCSIC